MELQAGGPYEYQRFSSTARVFFCFLLLRNYISRKIWERDTKEFSAYFKSERRSYFENNRGQRERRASKNCSSLEKAFLSVLFRKPQQRYADTGYLVRPMRHSIEIQGKNLQNDLCGIRVTKVLKIS